MEISRKIIKTIVDWKKKNPKEFWVLVLILVVGAVMRLYRIGEYMTFLGDEGRDVIIVRRLIVDFDPILVGPGTSIGNMYLGPLYYYLMAPALALAGLSPIGPSIQIALLGVVTLFLVWWIGREWFGRSAAIVASGLYAVAPTVIIFSRSSWNPNIMPFFSLLSVYSLWRVWRSRDFKWLLVLAVSFAFVLQSHYLGLVLAPMVVLFWILTLIRLRKARSKRREMNIKNYLRFTIYGLLIFALLMSPLLIFDYRHGWLNFTAMEKFFTERQATVSARPWTAIPKLWTIGSQITSRLITGRNESFGGLMTLIITAGSVLAGLKLIKGKLKNSANAALLLLFVWLGFALLGLGVYKQHIYDHYYGFFFAAPFLLLGRLSQGLVNRSRKIGAALVVVMFTLLIGVSITNSPLKDTPNKQLQRAEAVAAKVAEESKGEKFNLGVIAERNYEDGYQYFLEKDKFPVIDIDAQRADETITDQLFVVCELAHEKCNPVNDPSAAVANFGWSKVEEQWEIAGVILYKLVHTQ